MEDLGSNPSSAMQVIGSQAVNIACLCLSFPTCKVEMKTDAALQVCSACKGWTSYIMWNYLLELCVPLRKHSSWLPARSTMLPADREEGGLVSDMLTLLTLCTVALWFCGPVASEFLWPCWTSGEKFDGCQDSHHDITRQCQWELGVHKMIQSQRAGADR